MTLKGGSPIRTARSIVLALFVVASAVGCGGGGGGGGGSGSSGIGSGGSNDGSTSASASVSSSAALTATVIVDAAATISETGGDDLKAARGMFQSGSYPESNGGLESSATLLAGIDARSIRVINAEGGSSLDGSGNLVPADRLSWDLPWIKRYGLMPHVVVGQWQPAFLTVPAAQWDAATWAAYQDYATKFVRYVAVEYDQTGFAESMFEVGNEIDITTSTRDIWTVPDPNLPQADEGRYQHYMRVFAVWSKAVARVSAENPDRLIRIAGPALGGQTLFLTGGFWPERFIQDVAAAGLRLDVVTHHFYADVLNGWVGVPGSGLRTQLQRIRSALNASGRSGTPIFETEYGTSEGSDAVSGHINYSHVGAAWGAMFVREALAGTASGGSILNVRDNFGTSLTGIPTVAGFDHIDNGVDYPKAIYNVFRMFTMLPGSRKAVTVSAQQPDVRALASADAGSAAALVFNYNFEFNWPTTWTDRTVDQNVAPGFANLPFNGAVAVDRYLIDANTSNVAFFIDSGRALDYNASLLTRVEQCAATVNQGTLNLPARVLTPSAVSLWIVKSGGAAGLAACQ